RSRTPRSDSAVKDGRKFLAAFRAQQRRNNPAASVAHPSSSSSSSATKMRPTTTESPLGVPPGLADDALAQRLDTYQSCAPGLVRNLEAALEASSAVRGQSQPGEAGAAGGGAKDDGGGGCSEKEGNSLQLKDGTIAAAAADAATSADDADADAAAADAADADPADAADAADAAADKAAATAAAATTNSASASKPSPKTDTERSPERPSPEMLRQAAQNSQALFLSSVLPTDDFRPTGGSPPITPKPRHWSSAAPAGRHPGESRRTRSGAGNVTTSVADKEAAARWASLRRLQDQSVGLGSATEHQLGRALELCRNLRGLQVRGDGGPVSGHERMSWIDALQSTLYGLQEILAKRSLVAEAAKREAEAMGGPAMVSSVLNGGGGGGGGGLAQKTTSDATTATAEGGGASRSGAGLVEVGGGGGGGGGAQTGWLSGAQLKAFEGEIQARSSMEIAALESERRKLRTKVEMFQRQVQFLQKNGAVPSPVVANGASPGGGGGDGPSRFTAGMSFADMVDVRLEQEEQRHVKETLEAETASLRGSLEEKDGLIDALRQALQSSSARTVEETAADPFSAQMEPAAANVAQRAPAPASAPPLSVLPGRLVVGRGVFARSDGRSDGRNRERYRSRTSRLLSASGPVAMAEAEQAATAAKAAAAAAEAAAAAVSARREAMPLPPRARGAAEGDDGTPEFLGGGRGGGAGVSGGGGEAGGGGVRSSRPAAAAAAAFEAAVSGAASPGRGALPDEGVSNENGGDGGSGVRYQASAVTETAFRILRDSARVVRSRVGLDGGGAPSPGVPGRGSASSHAVLIL
ncbi:unnamed protein product, partial [Laminaria digitata]